MKTFVLALMVCVLTALWPGSVFAHPVSGTGVLLVDTCKAPDAGGTADLPAPCPFVAPTDNMRIIDGLPIGSTIECVPSFQDFLGVVRAPGGSLSGETETFGATLKFVMTGTGAMAGFSKTVSITSVFSHIEAAPRDTGSSVQSFGLDFNQLQGQLPPGDPDFDLLRVTAGTGFGLPSPGHVTLTKRPDGSWNVDSFFDITYRIDFIGHPGSPIGGMSGSTTATIRWQQGVTVPPPLPEPCSAPDAVGTADLPALCPYIAPSGTMDIVDGLPGGTTIACDPTFNDFTSIVRAPGGTLLGETEDFNGVLHFLMNGTGSLAGYSRTVVFPSMASIIHAAPRDTGASVQSFGLDLYQLQGQLPPGDPDFDLLRITAGTNFGMPSPGHTTLTRLGGGDWNVYSFFDITYRIDFVGHSGGPLSGMSGSTTATIRWQQGVPMATDDSIRVLHYGLYLDNLMDPIDRLVDDPAQYLALAGENLVPTFVLRNLSASQTSTTVRCLIAGTLDGGGADTAYNDSMIVSLQGFEEKTFRMNMYQFNPQTNEGDYFENWRKGQGTPFKPVPLRKGKCGFKYLAVEEQPDGSFKVTKHIVNKKDHDCPYSIEFFWDNDGPNAGIKPGHSLGGGSDNVGAGGDSTVEVTWNPGPGKYCVFAKTTIQGKTFMESLNHIKVKKQPPPPPPPGPPPPPPPPPPPLPWAGKWWFVPVPILPDPLCIDTIRIVVVSDASGWPSRLSTDTVYYPCPGTASDTVWLMVYVPDAAGPADTSRQSVVLIDKNDKIAGYSTYEIVKVDGSPGTLYPQAVLSWNLMSLPVRVPNGDLSAVYPTAKSNAFMFDAGYISTDSVWTGTGFWLKFDSAQTVPLAGTLNMQDTSEVKKGWNIIGSLSDTIPVASLTQQPPGIVLSSFFSYDGAYHSVTDLVPGIGYWVKVSSDGMLIHTDAGWPKMPASSVPAGLPDGMNSLTVRDALGRNQTLYFGALTGTDLHLERFELPPLPPEGTFDARFASQRLVEAHAADANGLRWPIQVQSGGSALTVVSNVNNGAEVRYALEYSDGLRARRVDLGGETTVPVPAGSSLALIVNGNGSVPTEYAVAQNYPNPFNPTSRIDFDLPEDGIVTIAVFDVLGREVARVLERQSFGAGRHSATIDAGAFATGVYFYRLEVIDQSTGALKFQSTRKMALVK